MARYDHDPERDRDRRFRGEPSRERRDRERSAGYSRDYRGPNYVGDFPDPEADRAWRRGHGHDPDRRPYPRDPYYPEVLEHPHIEHGDSRPVRPHDDPRDYGARRRPARGFADRAVDEVASWFGDEAAEARREDDHRGKGPRGYRRSDARIEEDVNDRLTEDSRLDASRIQVSVSDGAVTLSGEVDSKFAKRRAEDCADAVLGVGHVQNNIRVSLPEGGAGRQA
jgi:hypothetical protein